MTVYENNEVEITIDRVDNYESTVNVNGENLIWISSQDADNFKWELRELLDSYKI